MDSNDTLTTPTGVNTPLPGKTTAGDQTEAGDTDAGSTQSADETGQAGDPTDPAKNKAHPWNG